MFVKFPSIQSLAHVVAGQQYHEYEINNIQYASKVKLHGTNAGVTVTKRGEVLAQSRNTILTGGASNYGFAEWVKSVESVWQAQANRFSDITFFGEWAGRGIQKNDAVTRLNDRYFFVFAVQIGEIIYHSVEKIEQMIPDLDNVLVIPWDHLVETPVDFSSEKSLEAFSAEVNSRVQITEEVDPFIRGIFGVEGPGEGFVFYPLIPAEDGLPQEGVHRDLFKALTFKAKTEAHRVKSTKKASSATVEVPTNVLDFADTFVTPSRCEQALQEACENKALPEHTGAFLKWMGQDVKKESVVELEKMALTWGDVSKQVTKKAKEWWVTKCAE